MIEANAAALVRVIGFTVGVALYAMLLTMVLPERWRLRSFARDRAPVSLTRIPDGPVDWLLVVTAILGLVWNGHSLLTWVAAGIGVGRPGSLDLAAAYTALGFLPAVVVHSVLRTGANLPRPTPARLLIVASYGVSATAGVIHLVAAGTQGAVPSPAAVQLVTVGFVAIGILLGVQTRSHHGAGRVLWMVSLAVFAASARHLAVSDHMSHAWFVEMIHHASLPLVIAILYQDYPFAFADLFLKRALTWLLLTGLALVAYTTIIGALLRPQLASDSLLPVLAILGLCLGTALVLPHLRSAAERCVDNVILRRPNYQRLLEQFTQTAEHCLTAEQVLDAACQILAPALSARRVVWTSSVTAADRAAEAAADQPGAQPAVQGFGARPAPAPSGPLVSPSSQRTRAVVAIPTTEAPWYDLTIDELTRGRRLLSDDTRLLGAVAQVVARRVDALRLTGERFEQALRQQELRELAVEAELRALRAQLNPHFLFNALNTIGYLIQTSPNRAFATLLRLTELLRRVLRTEEEFSTLGGELDLATAYLDIERARFEDRLRVIYDIPERLRHLRLPTLLLQPVVENAVAHGVAPNPAGGQVKISARVTDSDAEHAGAWLCLSVDDTGTPEDDGQISVPGHHGIGLRNVEGRLRHYYGKRSSLVLRRDRDGGTLVEIWIPLNLTEQGRPVVSTRVEGNPSRL